MSAPRGRAPITSTLAKGPVRAALLVITALGIAAVVMSARMRAEPPARCAAFMIAIGPRCCGEGQALSGGRCTGSPKRCAPGLAVTAAGCVAPPRIARIAGGTLRVGPGDWEAQGVVTPYEAAIAPFGIDVTEVTEQQYAACEANGACRFVERSGEPGRPIGAVTLDEAHRYCRWAGGAVPTRDQLTFASAGQAGRRYPWGDTGAVCRRAAWGLVEGPCGWGATGPEVAGSRPDGASPEGVLDLAGNVAEWTTLPGGGGEARGGSFGDGAASSLRTWNRRGVTADTRDARIGFRCVYP